MTQPSANSANSSPDLPARSSALPFTLVACLVACALAWLICGSCARYAAETILEGQNNFQQARLYTVLTSIRAWQRQVAAQARITGSSESLRLLLLDSSVFGREELRSLSQPDSQLPEEGELRSLARQSRIAGDFLNSLADRWGWEAARLMLADGTPIAQSANAAPADDSQTKLVRRAAQGMTSAYGPVRKTASGLVMDIAEPILETLNAQEIQASGVILCTIPMDAQLEAFLAPDTGGGVTLQPVILESANDEFFTLRAQASGITIEPDSRKDLSLENMGFALRGTLQGQGHAYSSGYVIASLRWLYMLEAPGEAIDRIVAGKKFQIYALGFGVALALAFLAAWLWRRFICALRKAEWDSFHLLRDTIGIQDRMLTSMEATFKAGLALVDASGKIAASNPAFAAICQRDTIVPPGTPLGEVLPEKAALRVVDDVRTVATAGRSASDEITLPTGNPAGESLYRVTLYPGTQKNDGAPAPASCVAVFQDITEMRQEIEAARKKAENDRERLDALIAAFVRGVESVDPNLVGHSDKMAEVADLLAPQLHLSDEQRQTLILSAKLSQIGKIYVPRDLLHKKGRLTPEELREIRKGSEYADKILKGLRFDLPIRETVALMGERYDGSGSSGLTGEAIPLCGRALSVINAFVAMTSRRAWRAEDPMTALEAISQLLKDQAFDPRVVQALQNVPLSELDKIAHKAVSADS